MSRTSASLLERLRLRPDADGWQRLVGLYEPLVRSWLRRHGLQPSDDDDVVQEVLGIVVKELPHFEHNGRPGAFRSWLRTTTAHCLRRHWPASSPSKARCPWTAPASTSGRRRWACSTPSSRGWSTATSSRTTCC